ncbi:formate/nitrite transporter family protein [Halovivax limisalsi]|uniref:formate/nitrite transporter family protein n=1 Tax=Halovivax limisalsi TaxID=1453760 RepID=UPI001FFC571E|nr:formate/nitrite transporter family protein [Halovivax limisalsi]
MSGPTRPDGGEEGGRVPPPSDANESVRDAVERSRSGAPAVGSVVRDRFSSDEVFQRIIAAADEEVTESSRELYFSGLAAGFAITITFLLYASVSAQTESAVVASMLYPLGFVYIIIGGYQLYTENTLPPVALTLERLASIPALLRHWGIVLSGNFTGGALGAVVLTWGGVFEPDATRKAIDIARKGAFETGWWSLFFKALFAGLIVAGVVWVGFAATDTISRVLVVYLAFLAIPLGNLFHVVVSFTEVLFLVFNQELALLRGLSGFVLPVLLGNTIGGVVLVTVVNYYQTSEDRLSSARIKGLDRRLTVPEVLFGRVAGRSYVPILDAAEAALVDDDCYRVMVPITNPRTDADLVELGAIIASQQENDPTVHVLHVVQAPDALSLGSGGHDERIRGESEKHLEGAHELADRYDVDIETSSVATHRSFEEIFSAARRTRPNMVVMKWGENQLWTAARAERPVEELTNQLPCDFLIVSDRGHDASSILLPTAGGPDSDLSAEVARALRAVAGTEVSLLHVVDDPSYAEAGERFLSEWADDHGLGDATLIVDDSGDVEAAIEREAETHSIVLLGATERGLLTRLLSDSLHLDVVGEVEGTVMLAERPSERSLRERLFGTGRREHSAERTPGDD